jgi:lipocalin
VYNTFEKDAYCATAKYGIQADGKVSVHNYATIGAPDGSVYTIDGYAYNSNAKEPGQFLVHFDAEEAAPFDAPYWVLSLGPLNANNLYDWAIVSDNLSYFLFVLARDVNTFNSVYKEDVYAELTKLGFTGRTAPIDTYHGTDCVYEF